ncbi:MAG: hypothetical protein H6735_26130 [Alphaproteobacteria bacterium]|nr:hypothetical protein [Alphaproteobacteria bacterium]
MKGRWWIAVVAALGLVMAVLLMPKPNTGADVVRTDGGTPAPAGVAVEPGTVVRANGGAPRPERDLSRMVTGQKPGMERFTERRNRPEVIYSGKLIAPWAAVRYVLLKDGSDDAKALADELNQGVLTDLRSIRTEEDSRAAMDALEPGMVTAAATVRASAWADDPTVTQAMSRYEALLAEYHQALESQGVATEPAPAPAAPEQDQEDP